MAGLGYSLYFTTRGVCLLFSGYNDKMPDFITKIAEALATHAPTDPVEFERLRDVVGFELVPLVVWCGTHTTFSLYVFEERGRGGGILGRNPYLVCFFCAKIYLDETCSRVRKGLARD